MKKFLLSTVIPAIVLMALSANATSLTNFGALTISWTILQQDEPITDVTNKTSPDGKKATNTVYTYKATTTSSNAGNTTLLNLLSNSFTNMIAKGDKLATDGENIYVVDSTGSNLVLKSLSPILTWTYSDSLTSGAATITTNTAETTNYTYSTNITYNIVTNTNSAYIIIEVTNIVSTVSNTGVAYETNIDTTIATNYYYSTTNVLYTTVTNYTTNFNNKVNTTITGTNIYTYTNIDTVITAGMTNSTTNFDYYTNYTYTNMVVPITNYVVYTTNITTNTTISTPSGTATYTTTSYFTLTYNDPATTNAFSFHGLASTAIDVNIGKNTATENFSVKDGAGSGTVNGKTTLISGSIAGSAKGAFGSPLE